jgi:hypothetical protein
MDYSIFPLNCFKDIAEILYGGPSILHVHHSYFKIRLTNSKRIFDNVVFYVMESCLSSLVGSYVTGAVTIQIEDARSNAGSV